MSTSSATLWSRNATAKVVTSITAGDCVRSGRKTARSIASESAITTAKHAITLPATGHADVNASVYAPAMTSWPYAKLTSRRTPKTSPIPTAISAYTAPRPTASTSVWASSGGEDHERYAAISLSVSSASAGRERHPQLAVREDVRAVGERDRALRALLDEQDGHAPVADRGERGEDRVDHLRREPERRLVEQEHLGRSDERAADRELLLLAAGERAGRPAARLREHREELVDLREAVARLPSPRSVAASPSRRFSSTVKLAEDPPSLRDERDAGAGDRLRTPAPERGAREAHVAARRRHDAHDRVQGRRLARAVRADQADELALADARGTGPGPLRPTRSARRAGRARASRQPSASSETAVSPR